MWTSFIEWVRRLFGKKPEPMREQEEHTRKYEDINGENITATISNKLATLAFADSSVEVGGTGKRVELVKTIIDALWEDAGWITAQMMGKGGKVLVPAVVRGEIQLDAIDQSRMAISEMRGKRITSATILADIARIDDHPYYRWVDYTLDDTGVQTIKTRATTDGGREVMLGVIPQWADITPEITISGTDRVLLAFLRSPRDNRRDQKMYGVPITYGADRDVAELVEHLNTYRREFKLSRMMLGLDSTMWSNKTDFSQLVQPVGIETIKRTVQDEDSPFIPVKSTSLNDKSGWDVYAPPIRHEAMEARLQTLYRRLEKDCGLSQGILTERNVQNYANRDEVRAAVFDTYSVLCGIRKEWERALDDVAYAVDVLAERFGLTPAGARNTWEITVDWDTSMIESSAETWEHRSELESRGHMSGAELRAWETGETLEEAQAAIDEIESKSSINRLFDTPANPTPPAVDPNTGE